MNILIHPCYMHSIVHFVAIVNSDKLVFEQHDNYQKQTYRNRMFVYSANGKQLLNIPYKHSVDKQKQLYKDVRIENAEYWQRQHWRTLIAAYKTSPFFEFYQDDFYKLYHQKYDFLFDYNMKCFNLVLDALQINKHFEFTTEYKVNPDELIDLRKLAISKKEQDYMFDSYDQVFDEKYNHIPNLSILDLIFNEGTNAVSYLKKQNLNFI